MRAKEQAISVQHLNVAKDKGVKRHLEKQLHSKSKRVVLKQWEQEKKPLRHTQNEYHDRYS